MKSFNIVEAGLKLNCSSRLIRNYIRAGFLKATKEKLYRTAEYRISEKELEDFRISSIDIKKNRPKPLSFLIDTENQRLQKIEQRLQKQKQRRAKQAQRHFNLVRKVILHLGGKCIKCGYDKCFTAIVFHHKYDKKYTVRTLLNSISNINNNKKRKIAIADVLKEIKKCELLCSNCHSEVHARDIYLNWKSASWISP